MQRIEETRRDGLSGGAFVALALGLFVGAVALAVKGGPSQDAILLGGAALGTLLGIVVVKGLVMVNPNEAVVLQLFGRYVGTIRESGLRFTSPLYTRARLSVRVMNFDSAKLKVNDQDGNPVEIAAVVVMQVRDTAQARFQVNDFLSFVRVQAEVALRNIATRYPYDGHDEGISLRAHTQHIAEELKVELQAHVDEAGIAIIDAKISHLAYAPEIAHAMLQRQQASAIVAARQRIVEGAVGMVQMALAMLAEHEVVELDEERKAAMVSNLLVVLCGERSTQPVVNAGTIYQ
ncbi:MAG: SPFH domain-containing protein [Polyangiaceae bacterium]|nr:SPFH domain-containing protein [Polyangiaceae bacterium]